MWFGLVSIDVKVARRSRQLDLGAFHAGLEMHLTAQSRPVHPCKEEEKKEKESRRDERRIDDSNKYGRSGKRE